jgi:hypothetical protein
VKQSGWSRKVEFSPAGTLLHKGNTAVKKT